MEIFLLTIAIIIQIVGFVILFGQAKYQQEFVELSLTRLAEMNNSIVEQINKLTTYIGNPEDYS